MKILSHVIYRLNGGSGFNINYTEVMELPWDEIMWFAERLNELREAEAKATPQG